MILGDKNVMLSENIRIITPDMDMYRGVRSRNSEQRARAVYTSQHRATYTRAASRECQVEPTSFDFREVNRGLSQDDQATLASKDQIC
jgi:hypothetical protein